MLNKSIISTACFCLLLFFQSSYSQVLQNTQIRGFVDGTTTYANNKVSFGFGEQDLFITSQINDRFSFLGESVFKYSPSSATEFNVSIERVVIKYNYAGNHNILFGKHHTPINYWNDTYHHGRVFFPTIDRPLLFSYGIIPLHTTGIDFQGQNLGDLKFGYDLLVGNGIGSEDIADNDKAKSVTAAVHFKPADEWRIGASYYHDVISKGADDHGRIINWKVKQHLLTGSIAYFGEKFELLTEGTLAFNHTDTTGTRKTFAGYAYAGVKLNEKLAPYIRVDNINYQTGEVFFNKNNVTSFIGGIRYEINYLAVVKLEYEYDDRELTGSANKITAQIAIGF